MKVAIVGEYPTEVKKLLLENLGTHSEKFTVEIVDTPGKYEDLTDADCMILRIFRLSEADMKRNPSLKFVQKWGVGIDTVDIEAAGKRGILVSNMPGANAVSVADHAVLLMLSVYRNLIEHHEHMKQGVWTKKCYADRTYTLKNKRVGLVGCGHIGREVAKRVQGFGAFVSYYDVQRMSGEEEERRQLSYLDLDQLVSISDVVSLHLPLNGGTRGLMNRKRLRSMKPGSILINTARGGIVDENGLCEALEEGWILGAGLDCVEREPVEKGDAILKAPNLTLSPHVGGSAVDLANIMAPMAVENLLRFECSGDAAYVVNRAFLPKERKPMCDVSFISREE